MANEDGSPHLTPGPSPLPLRGEERGGGTSGRAAGDAPPSPRRGRGAGGEGGEPPRYRWAIFGMAQGAMMINITLGVSLGLMLPAIVRDLTMTPVEQGLLGSSIRVGSALLGIPAAWLLSRYRPYWILAGGLALGTLSLFVQASAPSYELLLAGRTLFGVSILAVYPARTLLYRQWFSLSEIAMVNGAATFTIGVVEWAAATFTPQAIELAGSWRTVLAALGLYAAAVAAAWMVFGRERNDPVAAPDKEQERPAILSVLRYRQVWLAFLGILGGPGSWWAFNTFWPQYMLDTYGTSLTTSGFVFGLTSLGMAPGSLLFGWLASKYGVERWIIRGCAVVMVLGSLGMVATDNLALLVLAGSAVGLSWGFTPITQSIPYHLPGVQPREVAVMASVIGTAYALGGVLGPLLAGTMLELTGSPLATLVALSFAPASLAAIVWGLPKRV